MRKDKPNPGESIAFITGIFEIHDMLLMFRDFNDAQKKEALSFIRALKAGHNRGAVMPCAKAEAAHA
jgi:hypothetical protein